MSRMPQVRLQIESEFGSLLDEQVDSAIVRKYQQLVDKGLEDAALIRALWSEDFEQKPAKARLTGHAANGRRINIEIATSSAPR